jgi:hypothetical protein
MNKRIKTLWIKALKSGEFKQCKGYLAKDGKYCALGVLSVLALLEGACTYDEANGVGAFDNVRYRLSYGVMRWAEIAQDNERFLNPGELSVVINVQGFTTSVMELNDDGKSFKQIAELIERYLE